MKFAEYLDLPENAGLIAPFPGKKFVQAFTENPNLLLNVSETGLLTSSEGSPKDERGRELAMLSGAWFWRYGAATGDINPKADDLKFDGTDTSGPGTTFYNITEGVNGGQTDANKRFINYRDIRLAVLGQDPVAQPVVGNPFEDMRSLLSRVGITSKAGSGYESQIGISFNKKATPKAITSSSPLTVDSMNSSTAVDGLNDQVNQTIQNMGLSPEEVKVINDFNATGVSPTVLVASAAISSSRIASSTSSAQPNKLGICTTVKAESELIYPELSAGSYYQEYRGFPNGIPKKDVSDLSVIASLVVLKNPEHGTLVQEKDGSGNYRYIPNKGFKGDDYFVITASFFGDDLVTIYYTFKVDLPPNPDADTSYDHCKGQDIWKISSTENPSQTTITYSNLINSALDIFKDFTDLPAGEVGTTTGEGANATITLDVNANGYGWYQTANPLDNSDFLPTADANIWVAKAGSAAAGKMDLLSVLMHEYGHALGLDHSTAATDAMAATLKVGERRVWSAVELAEVTSRYNQLLSEQTGSTQVASTTSTGGQSPNAPFNPSLPSSGLLLGLGLARRRDAGAMATGASNLTVANATLENGHFTQITGSTNGAQNSSSWTQTGNVSYLNQSARLGEGTQSQTALRQVFTVNAQDHFLRFTLNSDLHNQAGANGQTGPNDAFEVALLDANTGAALRNINGLTHSDALLNLQLNDVQGLISQSTNGLLVTENLDGSRTYTLDLAGINAGSAVELSFDLIGFGAQDSAVVVSGGKWDGGIID